MGMFTFSVFDRKYPSLANLVKKSRLSVQAKIWYPFWINLIQKVKFVSLDRNLAPRLVRILRIQW